jgi:hypothetical protein
MDWKRHKSECIESLQQVSLVLGTKDPQIEALLELNSVATASLTYPKSPTIITEPLLSYLEENGAFFHQGEYLDLQGAKKRFLCTTGVLTCIAVFAWTQKGNAGIKKEMPVTFAFVAHIDAECYLGDRKMHFLLKLMASTFRETTKSDIRCAVVGDHELGNPGFNTQRMGDDIIKALVSAGYVNIDTHLYKLFPGATLSDWKQNALAVNNALYTSGQCFFFVGIDAATGRMLSHTRFVDDSHPAPMWPQRPCDIQAQGHGRQFSKTPLLKSNGLFRAPF